MGAGTAIHTLVGLQLAHHVLQSLALLLRTLVLLVILQSATKIVGHWNKRGCSCVRWLAWSGAGVPRASLELCATPLSALAPVSCCCTAGDASVVTSGREAAWGAALAVG